MRLIPVLALLALITPLMAAGAGWRMDGTSRFPSAVPLTKWSSTDGVVWATELPGWSNASPVLTGDRILVTAEPDSLLCLDKDGKIRWQHTNSYEDIMTAEEKAKLATERQQVVPLEKQERDLQNAVDTLKKAEKTAADNLKAKPDDEALKTALATAKDETAKKQTELNDVRKQKAAFTLAELYRLPITHPTNGYTSNTPVTDGARVYASYGNGVVACYTLDGTRQWARMVVKPFSPNYWGQSNSPVLVGNKLIVQFNAKVNDQPSALMFALDTTTGKELWQRKQPHIWGTPAVAKIGAQDVLWTDTGDLVNAADGTALAATGFQLGYGSPLIIGDTAYCANGANAAAFKIAPDAAGKIQATKLWQTAIANDRYYASPLLDNGLLYVVNAAGKLSVIDTNTGEKLYEQGLTLGGTIYPSPILAGNEIIVSSDSGNSVIITPGRAYQEIGRCKVESFLSTPVCDGKRMYIRTSNHGKTKLYCFGS